MGITDILGTYFLSTEYERLAGRVWYSQALMSAMEISADHQVGIIKAAGVVAALSPNNKWHRNLLDADALIAAYETRGAFYAERVKVCTFDTNKLKAMTILKLTAPNPGDVATILNGRKTVSFFKCILGDQAEVCVDGHAYSIWAGDFISTTKTPSIAKRRYEQIQADYREAAVQVSIIESHNRDHYQLEPAQLQAITWLTHRRLKNGVG